MIVALDVGYSETPDGESGTCAVVTFDGWTSTTVASELVVCVADIAPYVSGRLFERELPCLVAGLDELAASDLTAVIVDGNVRLDSSGAPGLGWYLFDHLGGSTPVIGVAKQHFAGLDAQQVMRGESRKPLFVTAVGMSELEAAEHIRSMAGEFRIPTLLKRADKLSRR